MSASGWVHFLFWVSFVLFVSCRERARSRSCFTSAFTLSSRVKCQTQTEIRLKNTGDDVDSTREYGLTYSCGPEALTLCSADWRDGGDSSQGQRWFSGITKLLHVRCSQEGLWDHRRGNWVCVNIQYVKVTQTTYSRRYECQLAADGMKQLWVNFTDPDTTFQPARVKEDQQGSTTSAEFNRVLMRVCEQILQCWQRAGVHHLPANDFISLTHLSTRCAWHHVPLNSHCYHRLNPVETVFSYSQDQN